MLASTTARILTFREHTVVGRTRPPQQAGSVVMNVASMVLIGVLAQPVPPPPEGQTPIVRELRLSLPSLAPESAEETGAVREDGPSYMERLREWVSKFDPRLWDPEAVTADDDSISLGPTAGSFDAITSGGGGMELPEDVRLSRQSERQGRLALSDVSLMWDAYEPGPLTLSVIGGVRTLAVDPLAEGVGEAVLVREADRIVPLPVLGGAVRWNLDERMYLLGSSAGHTIDTAGTYFDLTAGAGFRFTEKAGIFAGYRYLHAEATRDVVADFRERGLYAQIKFDF